jgi:chemotaxis protein MotA
VDPGTLIGIGLAFASILGSMLMDGGNPVALISPPAMILVLGGTLGAAMASGLLKDTTGIVTWLKVAFTSKVEPAGALITTLVELADKARREGLLALEEVSRDVDHPFLKRGLTLAIDGTDPEELRDILEAEIDAKRGADKAGAKLFLDMGGFAPTLGIIGTVIGLVHVLENLNDPGKLGHLIAGAFVATLWGILTANIIWLPLGNKVKRVSQLQCQQMELVVEGIMAIQAGSNPRVVAQKLRSLAPDEGAADEPASQAA